MVWPACQVKILTFSIPFNALVVVVTNTETLSQPSKIASWTQLFLLYSFKKTAWVSCRAGNFGYLCSQDSIYFFGRDSGFPKIGTVVQDKICENRSLLSFVSPLVLHEYVANSRSLDQWLHQRPALVFYTHKKCHVKTMSEMSCQKLCGKKYTSGPRYWYTSIGQY